MKLIPASAALLLLAFPSAGFGQADASGPPELPAAKSKKAPAGSPGPLALAASLAFDATTWASIEVSTGAPAQELARLLARGYYRLELFQVIVLARRSAQPLAKIVEARDKGAPLRQLAEKNKLDYDAVYDEALELERKVDAILPSILTVSVSTTSPSGRGPVPAVQRPPR